ncbi:MAG: hypothetical protein GKC10_08725 [Methanosarcinales archaeon]|nr:hypothetical protein [Methanosarcinales archaeon]
MIEVQVTAAVKPTERVERVAQAVEQIFPELTMDIRNDRVQGYGGLEALKNLHRLLRQERILDTARSVMHRGQVGESVHFRLSKLGAFMGRAGFPPDEEPLGSIHVQVSGHPQLIDWLAPKTENGKPIMEIDITEDYV